MTNIVSANTARSRLGQIIRRASQKSERFVIRRRGEPKVILMGLQDYVKTMAPPPEWLAKVWAESRQKGLDTLTRREIDALITQSRRERTRNGES